MPQSDFIVVRQIITIDGDTWELNFRIISPDAVPNHKYALAELYKNDEQIDKFDFDAASSYSVTFGFKMLDSGYQFFCNNKA